MHVLCDSGEKVVKVSPDGYFHVPGILLPGQGPEVDVVIEHGGQTRRKTILLGQPGVKGAPKGHTVIAMEF